MININGEITEDSRININNRGFSYGDAIFETIRVINSKIIFWEDHYFRFMASMRIMRMDIPSHFSPEILETEILNLIESNNWNDSSVRIKITAFRKNGGFFTPETLEIDYCISGVLLDTPFYLWNESNYEIELFKDHFIISGLLSSIKTNNRAVNVLGSIFAKENEYENCLLLNERKDVVEALNSNIFIVNKNQIKTPPVSDGCINGIIRKKIIEILEINPDFTIVEESISAFELQKADEIFLTNVIMGIQPVRKYRKKIYEDKVSKNLLSKLNVKVRLG